MIKRKKVFPISKYKNWSFWNTWELQFFWAVDSVFLSDFAIPMLFFGSRTTHNMALAKVLSIQWWTLERESVSKFTLHSHIPPSKCYLSDEYTVLGSLLKKCNVSHIVFYFALLCKITWNLLSLNYQLTKQTLDNRPIYWHKSCWA